MTESPGWLWPEGWPILLLGFGVAWLLYLVDRRRWRRLVELVGPATERLAPDLDRGRRRWRRHLTVMATIAALVALLQPVLGEDPSMQVPRGADMLVALDVSRSMLAEDLAPSRLARAKSQIRELAGRVRGDRLGILLFAGTTRLLVPLTRDMDSLVAMVDAADPFSVEVGGSDLGQALKGAFDVLPQEAEQHQVVVLLTDGEDLDGRGAAAVELLASRGIPLHAVGFGTPEGSRIPDGEAPGGWVRDGEGREVVTSLNPDTLVAMVSRSSGVYRDARTDPGALADLYDERVRVAARALGDGDGVAWKPGYPWLLMLAFGCWLGGWFLDERKPS